MKIKLGVIFGGATVENEVSIVSALQAMENIDNEKYDIIPIYIDRNRTWYTGKMLMNVDVFKDLDLLKRYAKKCVLINKNNEFVLQSMGLFNKTISNIDIVLPIVHGNNVEDGSLAGYLNTIGVPFVGSGVLGSAVGQDKVVIKQILKESKLPIVDYVWFYDNEYQMNSDKILKEIKKMGYPVIVKPATLGSSIGINFAKTEKDIEKAIDEAIRFDQKIIVEKAVLNLMELNCSVLGNYESQSVSELEQVLTEDDFLTYKDKYLGGAKKGGSKNYKGMASSSKIIPAKISKELKEEVYKISKETFLALNLSGVCRIDFLVDQKTNEIYVNEPNTIPGSLSFYLWEAADKSYKQLLDELISLGIKNYKNKSKKVTVIDTNILGNYGGVKGIKGKLK